MAWQPRHTLSTIASALDWPTLRVPQLESCEVERQRLGDLVVDQQQLGNLILRSSPTPTRSSRILWLLLLGCGIDVAGANDAGSINTVEDTVALL